ncbi:hypothetical protein K3163_01665 [Qipengyuania sp. 1NDW9]|uniref:DUF4870 domain-containing protein n=2 Tax=Qipengyuania TaxID=1855416 RepID=A0A9Q3S2P1_9SPHN|nr:MULTISPECIES: hypothetical protein [Qipengyuania]MBX7491911.1 hypothetical protein [Qipengyuania xiapuensis]MBY6218897.1 hypothetical protein [Qipengyuania aquimaris]QZD91386.1 hypothetical protein K3162_07315 [Qipengyuania xiapuensis]UOR15945.1 hypothetical protein LCM05_02590 [Qipengyuania aquimaris]
MADDRSNLEGDRVRLGTQPPPVEERRRPPQPSQGFDANRPTIVSILYLASFVTGITGLIGIVLAHVWQGENDEEWMASHYSYLIRTFWYAFLAGIVATLLSIVFIGLLMFPIIAIWFGVRSVMSLMKAQRREPMPDPQTLLF